MFDAPVDTWYLWIGVAAASLAVAGVVLGMPRAAPPDATAITDRIDSVTTGPPGSVARIPLDATAVRIGARRVGLRGPGGTSESSVTYGPITPAFDDTRLVAVLRGRRPRQVFDTPSGFARAARTARERTATWRSSEKLVVRHIVWGDVDVTLVG